MIKMGLLSSDETVTVELEISRETLEKLQKNARHDRFGLQRSISSASPHTGVEATVTDEDARMNPDDSRTITAERAVEHLTWVLAHNRLNRL